MTPIRMERAESGIRTVLAFTEAFNRQDLQAMLNLVSEECLFQAPSPAPDGAVHKGKIAITQYWQEYFSSMARAHLRIEETFGFGFRCIILGRFDWVDATGMPAHLRGIDIYQVHNNLITEQLSYTKA